MLKQASAVTLETSGMVTVGVVAAIALAALVVAAFLAKEVLAAPTGTTGQAKKSRDQWPRLAVVRYAGGNVWLRTRLACGRP